MTSIMTTICRTTSSGELDVRLMEKEEESGRTESLNRMVDILLAAEVCTHTAHTFLCFFHLRNH